VKRPRKIATSKIMALNRSTALAELDRLAEGVSYEFSQFHRCGPDGPPAKKRTKPASHCPRAWREREAVKAIGNAIRARHISISCTNEGYPRSVWHKEGEVWYEAKTHNNAGGRYHGYPVEEPQVPSQLRAMLEFRS
jgi:hypothetical protein